MRICLVNCAPVGMSSIVAGILRPEQPDATILHLNGLCTTLCAFNGVVMEGGIDMHQILDFVLKHDQLIVDVDSSIGYKFLNRLYEYKEGINEFFDRFVIPVKSGEYYQQRTIITIDKLINLGVIPKKICIIFNIDEIDRFSTRKENLYKPSEKEIRSEFKDTIETMNKLGISVNYSIVLLQSDYIDKMKKYRDPINIPIENVDEIYLKQKCYLDADGTNGDKLHKIARDSFKNNIDKINKYIYKEVKNNNKTLIYKKENIIVTEGKTDWMHLKKALKRFKEDRLYIDLNIKFLEYEYEMGENVLNNMLESYAKKENSQKHIFIFDRDTKHKDVKKYQKEEFSKHTNDVYSLCIPKVNGIDGICIENYYKDKDLCKEDKKGRRLFLGDEFYKNGNSRCGKFQTRMLNKAGKKLSIIDEGVYRNEDREYKNSVALSKYNFANNIVNDIEGFDDFNIENFRLVFDVIRKIAKN